MLQPVGDVAELYRFHQKYFVADGRIMKVSIQVNLRNAVASSGILLASATLGVGQDSIAPPSTALATAGFVRLPSVPKPGTGQATNQIVRPASSFTLIPLPSLMLPAELLPTELLPTELLPTGSGGTIAPASGVFPQEVPEISPQSTGPKSPNSTSANSSAPAKKTSDDKAVGRKTVGSDTPLELLSLDGIKNLNHPVNPTEIFQRFDMSRIVKNPESVALLLQEPSGQEIPSSQDARDYGLWSDSSVLWDSPAFCHNPLYFEQVNLERYGIGYNRPVNAIVSGSRFFIDASLLPIRIVQNPHNSCTCTLGYLRPGNCNPSYKSHP